MIPAFYEQLITGHSLWYQKYCFLRSPPKVRPLITSTFVSISTLASKFNIASMVIQSQICRMGNGSIFCISGSVTFNINAMLTFCTDVNTHAMCEQGLGWDHKNKVKVTDSIVFCYIDTTLTSFHASVSHSFTPLKLQYTVSQKNVRQTMEFLRSYQQTNQRMTVQRLQ